MIYAKINSIRRFILEIHMVDPLLILIFGGAVGSAKLTKKTREVERDRVKSWRAACKEIKREAAIQRKETIRMQKIEEQNRKELERISREKRKKYEREQREKYKSEESKAKKDQQNFLISCQNSLKMRCKQRADLRNIILQDLFL